MVASNLATRSQIGNRPIRALGGIDLAEAGVRISAEIEPALGSVLAVGTLVGRVVRRLRGGFAVKFVEPQSWDTVEAKVLLNDLASVSWRFDRIGRSICELGRTASR